MHLFKNLTIYQLPPNYFLLPHQLANALAQYPSRQPGAEELQTFGFVAPSPALQSVNLVSVASNGAQVIAAEKIEKIIPAAAVNDLLAKKVAEIEAKEARKLPKKERAQLKDAIIFSISPNALTKSSRTYAYFDFEKQLIVVDSSSAKKAEDLLSLLRRALGSLPVVPLDASVDIASTYTSWYSHTDALPPQFTLEQEFELRGFENGVIRVKDQDPITDETIAHINTGMQVTKLGLTFDDRLTFVLTDALQVKKLKFLDLVQEQMADVEVEDVDTYFEATMAIQVEEFRKLLDVLDEELGFRKIEELPLEDEDLA